MADRKHYPRPPITEAVIELRFDETLGDRDMERVRDRFKRTFATVEEMQNIEVSIEGKKIQHKASSAGFKMTAGNAVDVIIINPATFGTVRLAPYESWESLLKTANDNFLLFTKILGRKKVVRLGVRFVNRFDIPNAMIQGQKVNEFLRLGISLSDKITTQIGPYSLVVNAVDRDSGAKLLIQSAVVPPALIDHASITLDTDAFWDADIPQRLDEMWEKVSVLRDAKNSVFENSITDRLRELFQ
jgi:uncharacterized protein (TIGR04255 family)